MTYDKYEKKDKEMPDCTICLIQFVPDDDITVFDCDERHHFHKKCGQDWLQIKTECPLCRFDFTEIMNEFISKEHDVILQNVAQDAVNSNNQPGQAADINEDQAIVMEELVLQFANSVSEFSEGMIRRQSQMEA